MRTLIRSRCLTLFAATLLTDDVFAGHPPNSGQGATEILNAAFIDALHFAAMIVCAVLVLRTAYATVKSRFLYHLAGVYAVIALYYLGSLFVIPLKLLVVQGQAGATVGLWEKIDAGWETINLIFSFLSSFWLLMVWYLVRHYPHEAVGKKFYVGLVGAAPVLITAGGFVNRCVNEFRRQPPRNDPLP